MFDRVACAGMRVEERALVDLSTLSVSIATEKFPFFAIEKFPLGA